MSEIIFSHPQIIIVDTPQGTTATGQPFGTKSTSSVRYVENGNGGSSLYIDIRPDNIQWPYGINRQGFPTYAGEVVQLLSAYIGNLQMGGTVRTYHDIELIYKWFINYMFQATQGKTGAPVSNEYYRYNEEPVTFEYPHRGWQLRLRPIGLPMFTYGTEVVAPEWALEAAVVEDETGSFTTFTENNAEKAIEEGLTQLNANFGAGLQNPFAYYAGYESEADIKKFLKNAKSPLLENGVEQVANWYNSIVEKFAKGEGNLVEFGSVFSKPAPKPTGKANQEALAGASGGQSLGGIPSPAEELKPGKYVSPFVGNVVPNRIDEGVDYGVSGVTIRAIGNAEVVFLGTYSGFPNYLVYKLLDGTYQGKNIYIAEGWEPSVKQGDKVSTTTGLTLGKGSGAIETGWAQGPPTYLPLDQVYGGNYGGNGAPPTALGLSFNRLLVAVGAPSGIVETTGKPPTPSEKGTGTVPAGYP